MQQDQRDWQNYLQTLQKTYVDCYEPAKLISESHTMLGEYDFFFEWGEAPTYSQLDTLMRKIDEALKGLGCYYTMKTE